MKTRFLVCFFSCLLLSSLLCACAPPEQDLEALPEVRNFMTENRVITWDPVENASGYLVTLDGKEYHIQENRFDYHFLDVAGKYKLSVIALGDGEKYGNSAIEYHEFTLKSPAKHGFDELGFEYTYIEELEGYEIDAGTANLSGNVVLPDYFGDWPVKRIAGRMFKDKMAYTEQGTLPNCFTERFCNKITTGIQLPAYLESIKTSAFAFIINLEEIEIPDTVVEIQSQAFEGCKRLKKVVLPSNLKEIPQGCFRNTALSEIILPEGLERIGGRAFSTPETKISTGSLFGDTSYGHIDSELSEIVIPASVKEIGVEAFYGRKNLETVTLKDDAELGTSCFHDTAWLASQPDGLVYFRDYLYCYAGQMPENTRIEIPASTKGICHYAFVGQENLCQVVIPEGVAYWGKGIFSQCSSLTDVSLPSDMTSIPDSMFADCTSLKRIILPEGITEIGACAFSSTGLESIDIPKSVKIIDGFAFASCGSLKEILLPAGVETIDNSFIEECGALEILLIPSSVKKIEGYPFWTCDAMTHIFFEGASISELEKIIDLLDDETTPMLRSLPIYYYSEEKPTEEGLYWHYVDGKPTPWEAEE